MIKVARKNGTLADLLEAHKADFIASGKRAYLHYIALRSTLLETGLLPESTIVKKSLLTISEQFLTKYIIVLKAWLG